MNVNAIVNAQFAAPRTFFQTILVLRHSSHVKQQQSRHHLGLAPPSTQLITDLAVEPALERLEVPALEAAVQVGEVLPRGLQKLARHHRSQGVTREVAERSDGPAKTVGDSPTAGGGQGFLRMSNGVLRTEQLAMRCLAVEETRHRKK